MKKTIKWYLTAFLTSIVLTMAMLLGLTSSGAKVKAETGNVETSYSCSSTAFSRMVKVEGEAPNRKITVETAIRCLLPTQQVALTFFGVGGYRMQDPTDEDSKIGIKGLSICLMGDSVALFYNTSDNTSAPQEVYKAFVNSSTEKTLIVIEEQADAFLIKFTDVNGEILDESSSVTVKFTDFIADIGGETIDDGDDEGGASQEQEETPEEKAAREARETLTFNDIVDANGYTHLSIASPSMSTGAFEFNFSEAKTICNSPIYYDDGSIFTDTLTVARAELENGRAINVSEAGFTYDAETGYSICSYVKKFTVTDGMTELTVDAGDSLTFRKLSYRYTKVATPIGSLNLDPAEVPWSYGDNVGGLYPGDKVNGISLDLGFTINSLEVLDGYDRYGPNPHFCICIGPSTQVLWPGQTTSDSNVFLFWFTVANNYLYVDFYDSGNPGSPAWTQHAQNVGFNGKFMSSVGNEMRFIINILPVNGVWDIYFAEYGEDGLGEKLTYEYDPSFNFNSRYGANFLASGGTGCNVAFYGLGAQGTLALYTYRTEVAVNATMRYKSSLNPVNATITRAFDIYGKEVELLEKEITSNGFRLLIDSDDLDRLAFVNFVTPGGISRTVSAFTPKVIFDDGVSLQFAAIASGTTINLYPEEVRVFRADTREELTNGLKKTVYNASDSALLDKVIPEFMSSQYVRYLNDGSIKNFVVVENIAKNMPIYIALDKGGYTDDELNTTIASLPAYLATEGLSVNLPYMFFIHSVGESFNTPKLKNFSAGIKVQLEGGDAAYLSDVNGLSINYNNGKEPTYDSVSNSFNFNGLIQPIKVAVKLNGYTSEEVTLNEYSQNPTVITVRKIDLTGFENYINEVKELKNSCYVSAQEGKDVLRSASWCTEATYNKLDAAITKAENTSVYSTSDILSVEKDLQKAVIEFYGEVKNGEYGDEEEDAEESGTAATSAYIACKSAIGIEIYVAPVLVLLAAFIVVRRLRKSKEEK